MGNYRSALSVRVMENNGIAEGYFVMTLGVPAAFEPPLPGQFVMLRAKGPSAPLLGRPLSVYSYARGKKASALSILYKVVGKGTLLFSSLPAGEELELMGPLGSHFSISPGLKKIVLIAGGAGIAPLSFLAERQGKKRGPRITGYAGAANAGACVGLERLGSYCTELTVSTDDGSRGVQGLVTELFEEEIGLLDPRDSLICACGPAPMIRRIAQILETHPVPCQVSLEERMACGVGACLGCAVPVRSEGGGYRYQRVCKDGPVFDIRELAWDC